MLGPRPSFSTKLIRPKRSPCPRFRTAFTLVELLVVISIIALLIAVLLPSLQKAREQSRMVKCLSNVRSMMMGVSYYAQDQRDILPGPLHPPIYRLMGKQLDPNSGWTDANQNTERPWFLLDRIGPYLSKSDQDLRFIDEVSTCPTLLKKLPDERFKPNKNVTNDFGVTGKNPTWSRPYHYLPNTWTTSEPRYYFGWINIGFDWPGAVNYMAQDPRRKPKPFTRISRPSDEWAIGEAWYNFAQYFRPPPNPGVSTEPVGTWQLLAAGNPKNTDNSSSNPLRNKPAHRDERGTNIAFFDGHAATFVGIGQDWLDAFPANRP